MPPKKKPDAKRRDPEYNRKKKRADYAKHAAQRRAAQNAKNERNRARELALGFAEFDNSVSIVNRQQLRDPLLLWMGPDGVLHREENLSAEELIRRFHRKEHHQ